MGLFQKIFGDFSSSEDTQKKTLPWIPLTEFDQLDLLDQASFNQPQLIYKHSTTCGISSMVLDMFSRSYDLKADKADLYFLDIHRSRDISNEIAERYKVRHESPQLLIVKEGKISYHTSHGAIADMELRDFI